MSTLGTCTSHLRFVCSTEISLRHTFSISLSGVTVLLSHAFGIRIMSDAHSILAVVFASPHGNTTKKANEHHQQQRLWHPL